MVSNQIPIDTIEGLEFDEKSSVRASFRLRQQSKIKSNSWSITELGMKKQVPTTREKQENSFASGEVPRFKLGKFTKTLTFFGTKIK